MATETRRVVFDFIGRDQVTNTMRRVADEAERLDGQMVAMGAGAAALAGPVVAAGVAFGAFAAVAAPSVMKVVSAQENLIESWDDLSQGQKESSVLLKGLTSDFKALSKSYEPQALGAFNSVVGTAHSLMPEFTKVVGAGSIGVQNLVGKLSAFAEGKEVRSFLDFTADMAPEALDQFGTAATTTGSIALSLIQDMAPLGLSMLQMANGTLTAVNAAAQFNPMLTQLAIGTLLLRGPITSAVAGVTNLGGRMRAAAGPAAGLSRSARLLNLATAAGPSLYIAAGAALGLMAVKAFTAKTNTEKLVDSLRASYQATGNNVAGYEALRGALQDRMAAAMATVTRAQEQLRQGGQLNVEQINDLKRASSEAVSTYRDLSKQSGDLDAKIRLVSAGASELAGKYRISTDEARRLATSAGVDLSQSMDKSGRLSAAAAEKIDRYKIAVDQAANPTWKIAEALKVLGDRTATAEQKTKALTAAYAAELGPTLAAFNATNQLEQGYADLSEQLSKSTSRMKGNTEASRQIKQAFASQIDTVWRLFTATVEETGSRDKATAAVRRQLPVLYALAGRNRDLRGLVDSLARSTGNATGKMNISRDAFIRTASSMGIARGRAESLWKEFNKIKSRNVKLDVSGRGHWVVSNPGVTSWPRGPGGHRAMGGPIPASWALGPGGPTSDDVPAWLSVNEHVITAAEVRAAGGHDNVMRIRAAMLRGEMRGYAAGGPVDLARRGSTARVADDVLRPIDSGYLAMVKSMSEAMATKWKKFAATGAGSVVGAARAMIGYPYSWGGGGPGGPSYGIGRGAGTFGFDCSGLTEYAWWKGRRVSIGGVTYSQHPNSTAIGGPRPGALGFNSSLGHVVLASDRPGYVIEAPFTGSFVREVRKSMPDWRWPKAAFAEGGRVRRIGEALVSGLALSGDVSAAKLAGIAGDPGRRRALGGSVAAGLAYTVGELGPETFIPRTAGTVAPAGSRVVQVTQNITANINVPPTVDKGAVGREVADCLDHYSKRGGTLKIRAGVS